MSHLKNKNDSKSSWLIQNTDFWSFYKKNYTRFKTSFIFLIKGFLFYSVISAITMDTLEPMGLVIIVM